MDVFLPCKIYIYLIISKDTQSKENIFPKKPTKFIHIFQLLDHVNPITNKSNKQEKPHTKQNPIRANKNAPKSQLKQNQQPPRTWFVFLIAPASDRIVSPIVATLPPMNSSTWRQDHYAEDRSPYFLSPRLINFKPF